MFSAIKVRASITDRDPVFKAKYIGSVETFVASGTGCTNGPVQKLWDNAGSERDLKRVSILINTNGLLMRDLDKKKDEGKAFSIINISFCNAESSVNERIFSWICKDENSPTLTLYAVLCSSKEKAHAMSLVLSRAFQIAYKEWKSTQVKEEREQRKEKVKEKLSKKSDSVSERSYDGSDNGSITESATKTAIVRMDSECQTDSECQMESENSLFSNDVPDETYLQPVSKDAEYASIDHKIIAPQTDIGTQKNVQSLINGDSENNENS